MTANQYPVPFSTPVKHASHGTWVSNARLIMSYGNLPCTFTMGPLDGRNVALLLQYPLDLLNERITCMLMLLM